MVEQEDNPTNLMELIEAQQNANFEENMARYTFVGNMMAWRPHTKNNARRMDIVRGNMKIRFLVNKAIQRNQRLAA